MSKYTYLTSPGAVADAVMAVSNSAAPIYEFGSGPMLDAANEAASLGFLVSVGNGVFEMKESGKNVVVAKDRTGYVMNFVDILMMVRSGSGAPTSSYAMEPAVTTAQPQPDRLPYDIGSDAFSARKHYSDNPYPEGDWRHNEWWLGWNSGRESEVVKWDDETDNFAK